MSWNSRRQFLVSLIVLLVIVVPVAIISFNLFYEPPTCFDSAQNSDEEGIDCGGSCALICSNQTFEPVVLWSRFFEVSPGIYNAIAYVENVNVDAVALTAPYTFKLFTKENVLLTERKGAIKIPPQTLLPIIETGIFTNQLEPSRITFKFDNKLIWQREAVSEPVIVVKDEFLQNEDIAPKIKAELQNISIVPIIDIRVIVIIYDENDNAIGASSTFVELIGKDDKKSIVFTWPKPFKERISRFEIVPLYEIPR